MAVAHKGSISMGLVLIPVGLYKTTVDNDIHFNQLDKESKARIKYKKYCSHCNKEVGFFTAPFSTMSDASTARTW